MKIQMITVLDGIKSEFCAPCTLERGEDAILIRYTIEGDNGQLTVRSDEFRMERIGDVSIRGVFRRGETTTL